MGRLVWFGVISLSPAGAVGALAFLAISVGVAGYAAGRAHGAAKARQANSPPPPAPDAAPDEDPLNSAVPG